MSVRSYRVKDVARVAGVTVRTLHHYDNIGLLVPSARSEAGYRLYSEDDLLRLQQILLGRELGLPLEAIRRTLDDKAFDREKALLEHRNRLLARAEQTEAMILSVDRALETLKGERKMDARELFGGFDPAKYETEVERRWGDTDAYREAARRTGRYSRGDWERIRAEDASLMNSLAEKLAEGAGPGDEGVLALAERHRLHIDRWYYPCSHSMHVGLAEMYVADDRFKARFEQHGEGLAGFLAEAIRANAARH